MATVDTGNSHDWYTPGFANLPLELVICIFEEYILTCQDEAWTFRGLHWQREEEAEERQGGQGQVEEMEEDAEEEGDDAEQEDDNAEQEDEDAEHEDQDADEGPEQVDEEAQVFPENWTKQPPFHGWFVLGVVCSRWKQIMDNTPTLYNRIRLIAPDTSSTKTCIRRSKQVELHVGVYMHGLYLVPDRIDEFRALWKSFFLAEAGRIKTLAVDFDWNGMDESNTLRDPSGYKSSHDLRPLTLGGPQLSKLKGLTIRCLDKLGGKHHIAPFIHYSELPCLRRLTTYRIPLLAFKDIPYIAANITKLSLTQALDRKPDEPFHCLMDILAPMRWLEHLSLDRVLRNVDFEDEFGVALQRMTPIDFPHLKTLMFVGNTNAAKTAYFLDHIIYPASVAVELGVLSQDGNMLEEEELTELRSSILRHYPNGVPCGGLFLRKHEQLVTTVSVSIRPFHPEEDLRFVRTVHASAIHITLIGYAPRNVLRFLVAAPPTGRLLDTSALSVLVVETEVDLDNEAEPWLESAEVWRATFGAMQAVRALRVSGQAAVHLPDALSPLGNVALFPALRFVSANDMGIAGRTSRTRETWVSSSISARRLRRDMKNVPVICHFSTTTPNHTDMVYTPDKNVDLDWQSAAGTSSDESSTDFEDTDA